MEYKYPNAAFGQHTFPTKGMSTSSNTKNKWFRAVFNFFILVEHIIQITCSSSGCFAMFCCKTKNIVLLEPNIYVKPSTRFSFDDLNFFLKNIFYAWHVFQKILKEIEQNLRTSTPHMGQPFLS